MYTEKFEDVILKDIHKLDSTGNHFVNGKLVNPLFHKGGDIGSTFDDTGLIPFPISKEVVVTGRVTKFEYFDHDAREMVYVDLKNTINVKD
ncbi:hypothetical protein Phi40:1_gp036 [Cellulophaga phage phi40:1]|jgi:hypothetical protein|uniref:Uncharacterized protein n=1 Tax=Cellulophaga phage phi38:1 TaxID=1327977 RepID=R9ZY78_9CAUD|nr:hypothetical protein Phi38:1_gp036 [Cellulophaga phage phi38:1]AGO47901.1 hypothetical protein Phi40:1_gp036 [Cellulophaga phage phi40:1]AGO48066.1 hypothetical protein Phi38:1_gp036 [Cellulophaga phage phi38:1]|tara:strand:+ start:367 stop:639 length:273 start_codon:yes stop_codon:yes gene_type:complete